jgi:hypothetical protein
MTGLRNTTVAFIAIFALTTFSALERGSGQKPPPGPDVIDPSSLRCLAAVT